MTTPVRTLTKAIGPFAYAALTVFFAAHSAPAQETAKVRGVLIDRQNAVIVRQFVSFESQGLKRRIESDDSGRFEIELPPGKYKLSVAIPGFGYVAKDLALNAGFNEELVIELEAAPGVPHPPIADLEMTIEAIQAPVFQKMGPRKLD